MIRMWYSRDHGPDGVTATTVDELRAALDVFFSEQYYLDMVEAIGDKDGQGYILSIGGDIDDGLGALRYSGGDGEWFTKGEPTDYEVLEFTYYGTPHEFPTDALIPLDKVVDAVIEFFHHPDRRPTNVDWQLKNEQ